ncbi:MAG: hypothetical protein WBF13_00090 [Candidatus Zixiibacteriota bacterium]
MAYQVTKKPWLGFFFVLIFGPFGFLYYSWKKALVAFLLFFLPNLLLYNLNTTAAEVVRWIVQVLMATYAYLDLKDRLDILDDLFSKILTALSIPIILLNFLGGIVAGIWLLFLGEWELVLAAFVVALIAPYAYSIITLFQIPLMAVISHAISRNRKHLALTVGFISTLIAHVIILFYVFYVVNIATQISVLNNLNIVALLLLGYGVATGPFSFMASKEGPEAYASFLAVFVSQVSYIICAVAYLLDYSAIALPIISLIVFGVEVFQVSLTSQTWDFQTEIQSSYDSY